MQATMILQLLYRGQLILLYNLVMYTKKFYNW